MNLDQLFFIIQKAKQEERQSGRYQAHLQTRMSSLHRNIVITHTNPQLCLFNFSVEYIEMAPRLIECVEVCAREAGKLSLFQTFIETAVNYFLHPALIYSHHPGLDGMMIKAYLCHRLVEEMYDNNASMRNSDLIQVEAIQANLLAHELIGEPFANDLDHSVHVTMYQLAGSTHYYEIDLNPFVEQARHRAWAWMHDYWQGLLERNHIQFHFSLRHLSP